MHRPFENVVGFDAPHGSNIIWRYMSLEKFLDMLERRVLRFTQAARMSDHRELWLPYERLEHRHLQRLSTLDLEEKRLDSGWDQLECEKRKVSDLRDRTYLSSWSIAQNESYALWKIYLGGSRAGVAIKSTFSALQKSISGDCKHAIRSARITYTDDANPDHSTEAHYIFQKSTHYEFEKELRLTIDHSPSDFKSDDFAGERLLRHLDPSAPRSLPIEVDLNTLIREIYLSPFVIGDFQKTFERIVRKIQPKLQATVKASAVRDS